MGPNAMTLVLWMLIFKLTFPLSSFIFIRRLFSSSSLSAIRVLPSAFLRLLIFLLTILIPACGSSGLEFCMMYSAYKLSKQVTLYRLDVLLSWFGNSFSSMSDSNCGFLTCIQISQEAGQVLPSIKYPQFVVIHTVQGFGVVNKTEVDFFVELFCFYDDPTDVCNLISGFSAFSESRLNIRNFMGHMLLKPSLEKFEHYLTSVWDECNCTVVGTFFGFAFLWDWNEHWHFADLCSQLNLLAYWVQHIKSIIF